MRVVKTNQAGQLLKSELKTFGGAYNFWEKFINNGVGSAKVIYDEGIEAFDALNRGVAGEISFVSFELLKDGLLLRLNHNQRTLCLGVKLLEIKHINLTGFRIEVVVKKKHQAAYVKIVHRGVLEIIERRGGTTSFSVVVREFTDVKSFFEKPAFAEQFTFRVSEAEPEKDYSHWLNFLGGV